MAYNARNHGQIIGHVGKVTAFEPNKDGSRTVALTVYAQSNTPVDRNDPTQGMRSDRVELEAFVPAEQIGRAMAASKPELGVYSLLEPGMMVAVDFSIRSNDYTDKAGNAVYTNKLRVESVTFLEPRATFEARKAAKAAAQAQVPAQA